MTILVQYFGMLPDKLGRGTEDFHFDGQLTVGQLRQSLAVKYPVLGKIDYKVAIGQTVAQSEDIIEEGQNVAVLPPYAGG